jgi:raffinose/stachyose/melibiose transport system permease protein
MKLAKWFVLAIFLVIMLVPFVWLVLASFKTSEELFSSPFRLPLVWSFDNYRAVLTSHPIPLYFLNSLIVAVGSTLLGIAIATLAAYVFKYPVKYKSWLLLLLTIGIFIPTNAFMVPYYYLVNWLGFYNTLAGIVLVYAGMSLPLGFLIIKTYMDSIPNEMLEAAFIDGAGVHKTFLKVILPVSYPGLITASIFLMITAWNELLFASLLTQSEGTRTLQVAIRFFLTTFQANYPQAFAAMVIAILPTVIIYVFLSEKIIGGLTAGAVK